MLDYVLFEVARVRTAATTIQVCERKLLTCKKACLAVITNLVGLLLRVRLRPWPAESCSADGGRCCGPNGSPRNGWPAGSGPSSAP